MLNYESQRTWTNNENFLDIRLFTVREQSVHQRHDLQSFTKTHAMRQNTSATVVFIKLINRFKTGIPHEFHTLTLMRLQLLHQFLINRNELFFRFRIKVQYQFVKFGDFFQFVIVHFIVLKIVQTN